MMNLLMFVCLVGLLVVDAKQQKIISELQANNLKLIDLLSEEENQ